MRRTASTLLDVLPDGNDVIDLVFEGANPNPARLACPARDVLEQLAGRALPIEHAGYSPSRAVLSLLSRVPDHAHARKRATEPAGTRSARALRSFHAWMHHRAADEAGTIW